MSTASGLPVADRFVSARSFVPIELLVNVAASAKEEGSRLSTATGAGEADLRRILRADALYCNDVRTRSSLSKDAPYFRCSQPVDTIVAMPIRGGLRQRYARV
jgi:hypothetical protein